jgi:membrane-bound serine protease (ClpP class)
MQYLQACRKTVAVLVFLLLIAFKATLCADDPIVLHFQGYINQEKIDQLNAQIEKAAEKTSWQKNEKIYLIVNSLSGDLVPVLDFAKKLFEIREQHKTQYIIYISDKAIGPAAIIPFLADELYGSPTLSWGAITSEAENSLPINVLQSSIQGLIEPSNSKFSTLKLITDAMCDPQVPLSDENGLHYAEDDKSKKIINRKGETLVLNRYELQRLGLASGIMSYNDFLAKFLPEEKKREQQASVQVSPLVKVEDDFDKKLAQYVHYQTDKENRIGRIVINDSQNGINESTWIYVNSALSNYKKTKPICLILELNTPGGEVFAAQRISDALKDMDTQYGIPVIAYINNWAISAGAMLAYSCRYIVIAKDASMGAAEPVYLGEAGQMQTASEKVNSALRTDFANRASFFGRNPNIAEAMVDKDLILVKRHGEIIKLDLEDQIRKGGIDPDIIIKPKGKLLTLNAEQLIEFGVADMMLVPVKLPPITEPEVAANLWPLAKTPFSEIPYFKKIPSCSIDTYQMNWQTRFLAFLALPAITSILFLGMIISFYVEISASTFGFAGVIGLLCLFFIILSSFALEAIFWLEPILLLFGVFLIALEIFFFPTLGILAVIGGIFTLIGLLGMMLPGIQSVSFNGDTLNAAGEYVLNRLGWFAGSLLVALFLIVILSRFIKPHFRVMQRFVLGDTQLLATGTHEMKAHLPTPQATLTPGEIATVVATLRPAGKILIHEQEFDAISTGSFIDKGKQVKIVKIEGEKIVVEEVYNT